MKHTGGERSSCRANGHISTWI